MLHIVQTVFAGAAEAPRVFLDPAAAEAAFVEQVKTCWRQSYPAWCERSGVGVDGFSSARSFLETLDLAEKSRINYWSVTPEDAGPGALQELAGVRAWRENVGNSLRQVAQRSAAVRDELAGVLDELAQLVAELDAPGAPPAVVQAPGSQGADEPSPGAALKDEGETAEKYASKEWKAFVGTLVNLSGGSRSDFPPLPRTVWRQEVYSDATSLEYWDWVAVRIEAFREKAQRAGYAVIEDPESPGHYRVRTPEGATEETSFYSEWEAWCQAGMQLS